MIGCRISLIFCWFFALLTVSELDADEFGWDQPSLASMVAEQLPARAESTDSEITLDQPAGTVSQVAQVVERQTDEESKPLAKPDAKPSKSDDSARQADRHAMRMEKLRRPLSSIRVIASDAESVPANPSSRWMDDQTPVVMPSGEIGIPRPRRYTASFQHRPLYYEELNLERCGKTHGCATNAISGFYFLANTIALPYRMSIQHPSDLVCPRGDCLSCQSYDLDIEPLGYSHKAALMEAAAIAGFVFLAM